MSDNYEADVQAALWSIKLAKKVEGREKEIGEVKEFLQFLEKNQVFKDFYNLMKRAETRY